MAGGRQLDASSCGRRCCGGACLSTGASSAWWGECAGQLAAGAVVVNSNKQPAACRRRHRLWCAARAWCYGCSARGSWWSSGFSLLFVCLPCGGRDHVMHTCHHGPMVWPRAPQVGDKIFSGRMRIVAKGELCEIRIEDPGRCAGVLGQGQGRRRGCARARACSQGQRQGPGQRGGHADGPG